MIVHVIKYKNYKINLSKKRTSLSTHIPQVDNKSSSFCLVMILIICSGKYVLLVQ